MKPDNMHTMAPTHRMSNLSTYGTFTPLENAPFKCGEQFIPWLNERSYQGHSDENGVTDMVHDIMRQ